MTSLGPGWAERGAAEVRFTAPAHDGDQLTAAAAPSGDGTAVEAAVTRDETGQVAATARAWLLGPGEEPPDVAGFPPAELPASPPPFSERLRRVELEEPLSVRGHIDRLFGRRGNRYYVLDMAYVGERGDMVMAQRHTGIYRPRPRKPAA